MRHFKIHLSLSSVPWHSLRTFVQGKKHEFCWKVLISLVLLLPHLNTSDFIFKFLTVPIQWIKNCKFCINYCIFILRLFLSLQSNRWLKQTSANRGPHSRFVLGVIIKALIFMSSRNSILKIPNCLRPIHDFQPDSSLPNYLNFHMCLHVYVLY